VTHRILIERLIFCDNCVKVLADDLGLSERTIRRYLREIALKLKTYDL